MTSSQVPLVPKVTKASSMENKKQNNEGFIPQHGGYRNLITNETKNLLDNPY